MEFFFNRPIQIAIVVILTVQFSKIHSKKKNWIQQHRLKTRTFIQSIHGRYNIFLVHIIYSYAYIIILAYSVTFKQYKIIILGQDNVVMLFVGFTMCNIRLRPIPAMSFTNSTTLAGCLSRFRIFALEHLIR